MAANATENDMRLAPGTVLAGTLHTYRLQRVLGQGGFGITYEAEELERNKRVALKEYFPMWSAMRKGDRSVGAKPEREEEFQAGMQRFSGEARMLASFRPLPSVVQVMDCFQANGTAYLVMEFLDGVPLHRKAEQMGGRIPAEELLPRLSPLLDDLEELHQMGILHRDIAPDNIMWMPDGRLKLMDFGSARRMEGSQHLTIITKPRFAPVEQYTTRGQGSYTDVYALCATLYYLMTGVVPPLSPDRLEGDELKAPTLLGAGLTPEEESAILHGLAVQPKDRTQSMRELKEELFRGSVVIPAPDPKPVEEVTPKPWDVTSGFTTSTMYQEPVENTIQDPVIPPAPKPVSGIRRYMRKPWFYPVAGAVLGVIVLLAILLAVF
ncbi:MAG: serine/threonine protein kinase [Lachnospiraceae bacterium]|nr:serine/threonine protein kinase [Lachnospiraceae bacterium]